MSSQINQHEEKKTSERDFRELVKEKRIPKAVADGLQGKVLAVADIAGTPEQVFHAITSNEVEQWWKMPGVYRRKEWKADVKVGASGVLQSRPRMGMSNEPGANYARWIHLKS